MSSAIGSILLGATSNLIYDVLKFIVNKKRASEKKIESYINRKIINMELKDLDSGSFSDFLRLPSTNQSIKNFVDYNFIVTHKNNKKKSITRNEYIDHVTNSAIDYVKRDVGRTINYLQVREYFKMIIESIEDHMKDTFPDDMVLLPYIIENKINELESRLLDSIKAINNSQVDIDYEKIRGKYIKYLQSNYKKQFVYGIARLDITKFYVFPKFIELTDELEEHGIPLPFPNEKHVHNWKNIFLEYNMISIVGGPGFGKTLFLKSLISNYEQLNFITNISVLPIYCNLKEYKFRIGYSIKDFILESMINTTGLDKDEITKEFLEFFMNNGRCMFLFDALDEVESTDRERLSDLLVAFFQNENSNNKVCITTRERGLIPDTPIVFKVRAIDYNDINIYLSNMVKLKKIENKDVEIIFNQCIPLIDSKFLTNFLMLSLMIHIFNAERKIPENKVDLYEKCTEYIYRTREIDEKQVTYNFDLMRTIITNDVTFEKLAYLCKRNNKECNQIEIEKLLITSFSKTYPDENSTLNAITEFLKFCSERTELFVMSNENVYKFFHRSFFEFYYAKYMLKNMNEEEIINELSYFGADSEIFELLISLQKKMNYEKYISLQELIIKEMNLINSKLSNTQFQIILDFILVSDEHYLLTQFCEIIFNNHKLLLKCESSQIDKLVVIFNKIVEFPNFFTDLCVYYREELIASIILETAFRTKILEDQNYIARGDVLVYTLSRYFSKIYKHHETSVDSFLSNIKYNEYNIIFNKQIRCIKEDVTKKRFRLVNADKLFKRDFYKKLSSEFKLSLPEAK